MTSIDNLRMFFRSHANLPGSPGEGLSGQLRLWIRGGRRFLLLMNVEEIVFALQCLNEYASNSASPRLGDPASHEIAYAMSCILADLARSVRIGRAIAEPDFKRELEWSAEVLSHAWSQYLAGDIDNLVSDLRDSGLWSAGK